MTNLFLLRTVDFPPALCPPQGVQVSGFRFQVSVSGFRFQVSGFRFQVSGFRFQVLLSPKG